ncbi:MAG TPA: methyltransferase domain-containing protein [Vicinamibacterales bacterium]
MTPDLLEILACPDCRGALSLTVSSHDEGRIDSGTLRCASCARTFPIVRHIPRFVPADTYASSFGFQWNTFRTTQLDSHTGLPISRERLIKESRWTLADLAGRRVLDVGCGAGRFAEVALSAGASLVAMDYSSAVDACFANLGRHPRLCVLQADVRHLPLKPESFDYVYCLGVLQHTADPHQTVLALAPPLKHGGRLVLDCYPRLVANLLWPKYWLRPVTRRMPQERLFAMVQWLVPKLLPIGRALAAIPRLGRRLRYLLPIMTYYGVFPLTREQHREWATLDTFDMLAPAHDHPQTAASVRAWLTEAGLRDVEAAREGLVVGRAVKG